MRRYGMGIIVFFCVASLALLAGWLAGLLQPATEAAGIPEGQLHNYWERIDPNHQDPWAWVLAVSGFALAVGAFVAHLSPTPLPRHEERADGLEGTASDSGLPDHHRRREPPPHSRAA